MTPEALIFLSHSRRDKDFTLWLAAQLRAAGFTPWVDAADIPPGSTWPREIEKAVQTCGALVVVMTAEGRASEWVERETLLAASLGRPIFVARLDETPLPIHLFNTQYTDFRRDRDEGARQLIAALQALQAAAVSVVEHGFFTHVEAMPNGSENARVARLLYAWAKERADGIHFSGRAEAAFHADIYVGAGGVQAFSVRAFRRQPAAEVPLQYLSAFPPYEVRDERLAVIESLRAIAPDDAALTPDRADGRPSLALAGVLSDDGARKQFLTLAGEIARRLRAGK